MQKDVNFSEWYSELIVKAELMDYYDISGCYVIRPWAYSIWQTVQRFLDERIHAEGVDNAYFPMFLSKAALEREKTHVTDFAPEVSAALLLVLLTTVTAKYTVYPVVEGWLIRRSVVSAM